MSDTTEEKERPTSEDEITVLDPSEIRVTMDDESHIDLHTPDGTVHRNVRVVTAFPVSRPNRFVYFQDSDGAEIGMLVEPRRLDRESREIVLPQLDQAYFMPHITRIVRIEERMGMGIAHWEVETDRGWNAFELISRSESVWYVGKNRVVLRDADGNRYLIEDLSALDKRSRRLADLYL
jgi:hypothetical protein